MIEVFEGRLGGGKTYNAVRRMISYLGNGGTVCTNIGLVLPEVAKLVRKRFDWEMDPSQVQELQEDEIPLFHETTPAGTAECPTLVIIDEAQLYFSSRETSQNWKQSKELMRFLTQSRHCHTDVIFITQNRFNLDGQMSQRLVQYVWQFRDMSKYKIPGLGIPWPTSHILEVQYDYDCKTVLYKKFATRDLDVFKCYNTHELRRTFKRAGTVGRQGAKVKRKPVWHWVTAAAIVGAFGYDYLCENGLAPGLDLAALRGTSDVAMERVEQ